MLPIAPTSLQHSQLEPADYVYGSDGSCIQVINKSQQIQSVIHHSMSACTIRCRLQLCGMSTKYCFGCLSLETTVVCTANGAMNGGHGHRNGTSLCLLKNPSSAYNINMIQFKFEASMERGC
ncbi:hypothetical protein TNCV_4673101 [Trichonephila clavipes]|nr:hypothetical protein TNCV_4673101 [Trichonephila clavipes]